MLDILKFVLSDFWTFVGSLILLWTVTGFLGGAIYSIGKYVAGIALFVTRRG